MTTYFTSSSNFQNDCVSPITPPPRTPSSSSSSSAENPFLMKYLRSSLPSDNSSPYLSFPIMNYYRGNVTGSGGSSGGSIRTPLSPIVMMEEDMLVMDGVLVGSKSSSKSSGSLYKTELCKAWEDSGYCRYGSKCQFAHGQEELRLPNRYRNLKNLEHLQVNKPKISSPSSASPRNAFSLGDTSATPGTSSSSTTSKLRKPLPPLSMNLSPMDKNPSPPLSMNWSPMDDGISVNLPSSTDKAPTAAPTSADVDAYINNLLYGPPTRKRLPIFREICPDQ